MRSVSRWWAELSATERLEIPTRWSLVAMSAAEPVLVALVVASEDVWRPAAGLLIVVAVAHAGACVALLHAGFSYLFDARRPPYRLVAAASALTAVALAVSVAAFPRYGQAIEGELELGYPVGVASTMIFGAALTAAVAPLLRLHLLAVCVLVPATVLAVVQARSSAATGQSWAALYAVQVGVIVLVYRSSAWSLRLIREIDHARDTEARLAVAEERLRFARDLHDVLGRNLALVAVKSDLAAELVRRGDESAVDHMLDVRQVAQESMREVRAVVGGYRSADLDAELAGARSVLSAAGISVRVVGHGHDLPPSAHDAFGWVVREAVTNIIRHSAATAVTVTLDVTDAAADLRTAVLRIANDGARGTAARDAARDSGTGLLGLGERLAARGGQLTTSAEAGSFVVVATLPVAAPPMRGTASRREHAR